MELGTLDWAGIGALLLAFATIWKALRETPTDVENVEADTTEKYIEIANKSATLLSYHLGRNAAINEELEQVKQELKVVKKECEDAHCSEQDMLRGITKLIKQLESLGVEPKWTPPNE